MSRSRAYQRTDVKQVDLEVLRDRALERGRAGVTVGLDIGKSEIVACLRWPDRAFERPWSIGNPGEIEAGLTVLKMLKSVCGSLTVGLESTGTYGEAMRRALTQGGLEVHRISGKATSDYHEIFDGVPSQHDGKDAAVIAELTAYGKGRPWPWEPVGQTLGRIKHQVARAEAYRGQQTTWSGRLEGLLGRHWPEVTRLLALESLTLLRMLEHYRSPARVAADAEAAARLARWGGPKLTESKIQQVIESARLTRGVPVSESEEAWVGEVASNTLSAYREVQTVHGQLKALLAAEPVWSGYTVIGAGTLAGIWAHAGDPRDYDSGGAFLKALGLNLKECSSGRRQGELAITKRGSSQARRWIFFWALRAIQREELASWYAGFTRVGRKSPQHGKREARRMKGVVAVMRKLARGLRYAMVHEEAFDYSKLLESQPLAGKRRRRKRRGRASVVGVS
jgi:transposase